MALEADLGGKGMPCGDRTQDRDTVFSRRDQLDIGKSCDDAFSEPHRSIFLLEREIFSQSPAPALRPDAPFESG
jgi:hypothetical protein